VRTFLGFSFTHGQRPKRRLADKTLVRFRARVRKLTRRVRGVSLRQMVKELAAFVLGWRAYFGFCETSTILRRLDKWIRAAASRRRLETMDATRHALPSAAEARRQRQGCHPHGPQQSRTVAGHLDGGALLGAPGAYFDSLGLPYLEHP
jgi:RNA-directed DNA polymerase